MNAHTLFALAEIRREELLQQAEQFRLAKQSAGLHSGHGQRGSGVRIALIALGARFDAMRKRREAPNPIDLTPTTPEAA